MALSLFFSTETFASRFWKRKKVKKYPLFIHRKQVRLPLRVPSQSHRCPKDDNITQNDSINLAGKGVSDHAEHFLANVLAKGAFGEEFQTNCERGTHHRHRHRLEIASALLGEDDSQTGAEAANLGVEDHFCLLLLFLLCVCR